MQKVIFTVLVATLLITSCSTTRKASRTKVSRGDRVTNSDRLESVIGSNLSNNDFYIRRADINSGRRM